MRAGYLPVEGAELYFREVGQGQPIIVLHGGPDFDHNYLLPELDALAASFRLIYYDQRGRGRSALGVQPEDVSMSSDVDDLERLRKVFELETAALFGHSWGALLALAYAIKYPGRVSHLVLANSAPVSHADLEILLAHRRKESFDDIQAIKSIRSTPRFQQGDLEADVEYHRVHFRATVRDPVRLESVVGRLRANFTPESILKARKIEDQLVDETWRKSEFSLLPMLRDLEIPTLILHGEHDFVPLECSAHIAQALPGARLVSLKGCGHFSFLDCPAAFQQEISKFFFGA